MRIVLPVSLLIFLFAHHCSKAQSVYYFKYFLKDGADSVLYQAFFERDADGTGFIRLRFTDSASKNDVLVEMNTEDSYYKNEKGKNDSSVLYFAGHYPEVLQGNKNAVFTVPVFWFKRIDSTGFYEPASVTSQDGNASTEAAFSEKRLLQAKDLTREMVEIFFNKDDGLFQNLFDTLVTRGPEPFIKPVKLHVVIVANTNDRSIGTTCVKDMNQTQEIFSDLGEYLNVAVETQTIFGKEYSKKSVEQAINKLSPAADDIVVFYYSGHGYNITSDSKKFPYIDLRPKTSDPIENYNLNMEDIYNRIRKKGARLNIVFSDCCNADPNAASTISSNIAQTRGTSMGWSRENCTTLFLDQKPFSLLMTAAEKGELSAGNNDVGGIFSFNFRESIESHFGLFYKNVSWANVLQQAQKQTISRVAQSVCPQADGVTYKPCVQHPMFRMD